MSQDVFDLGILEQEEDEDLLNVDNWEDIMIEVVLDSGACRHAMAREGAPGHPVHDSIASRRDLGFIVGIGEPVPNEEQFVLNLEADNGRGATTQLLASTFQVADRTRPLMSVSQICEQGFKCVFQESPALVVNPAGETVCKFERSGQLYTAKMKLKQPEPFARPI